MTLQPDKAADSTVSKIGKKHIMTIKILNDDMPGKFEFDKRGYIVRESCGETMLIILREDGADGDVELTCVTTVSAYSLCNSLTQDTF